MNLDHLPVIAGDTIKGHGERLASERLAFLVDAERAGRVSRFRVFHKWILSVNSPDEIHELLVEQARLFEKSPGVRIVLHDVVGDGLFTSEGELWQRQRRLMAPLFHSKALGEYAKLMNVVARNAARRMRDGQVLDLAKEMNHITMAVVGATLFGAETFEAEDEIGEALTAGLEWVDQQIGSAALVGQILLIDAIRDTAPAVPDFFRDIHKQVLTALEDPILLPGRMNPKYRNALRTLDTAIHKLIADRRASTDVRADLLTKLLLARDSVSGSTENMSDKQVRDESMTLFVAGHETTANALSFCFHLLAKHPEARARVEAEADAYGRDGDRAYDPLRLDYTTRVFKEALRLYPPVLMLFRRSESPFTLGGVSYPARVIAMANVYGMQRSSHLWESPDAFDPDRFLPENEAKRSKAAFIPFGLGPRVCIGNNFALMEGPIVLATLMHAFRFEIDATREIEADATITLRPKGGVPAVVRSRH